MKRVEHFILIIFIILFSNFQNLSAQRAKLGIGIILGKPTGITSKYWINSNSAFVGGLSWSIKDNALYMHLDYVKHDYTLIRVNRGKLAVYYGIGGKFMLAKETNIGVRMPVGLNYIFQSLPIDLFLEIVPSLILIPSTDFDLDGGIGMRYFF